MIPIPEGVERDEEEPKDDDSFDDNSSASDEQRMVDLKAGRRWVHNGKGELNLID